jgi:molybdopterin/thiamine biosynthesis adenylyltransferase/rhodanese-related sulfurtransferase
LRKSCCYYLRIRQIIHNSAHIGYNKAVSAALRLQAINPNIKCETIPEKLTPSNAIDIIRSMDLIVDCTDNFEARYIINDACILSQKSYVSGSAVGLEGQVTVIVPQKTACYRCLYSQPSVADSCRSCADAGVLGPVPGLIGCLQATEALKYLLSSPMSTSKNSSLKVITSKQIFYDARNGEFYSFGLPERRLDCKICGNTPSILSLEDTAIFLDEFHQEATLALQQYKGQLPTEHEISIIDFSKHILFSRSNQNPSSTSTSSSSSSSSTSTAVSLIIDVRSRKQFEMVSLSQYTDHIHCIHQLPEITSSHQDYSTYLISLPLSDLQSSSESTSIIDQLQACRLKVYSETNCMMDIYLLCRRGIDSTVATNYLISQGLHENVFNVIGGLTAWSKDVDKNFPMY